MGLISRVSSRTYRKKSKKIMDIGEQRSFHKQPSVVLVRNKSNKTVAKRHVHSVGLGIKTPKDARSGSFIDKKCPFTGNPAIRDINAGDLVTVGECRPLAKTVKFNVIKINKTKSTKKGSSKF